MSTFFDTSAFVKKYLPETGSETVTHFLATNREIIFVSALTELEIISTIEISKKGRRINSPSYRKIFQEIGSDFGPRSTLSKIGVNSFILEQASLLIRRYYLRSPDSIQLSTLIFLCRELKKELTFYCCDEKLKEAALLEGLKVFDPTKN